MPFYGGMGVIAGADQGPFALIWSREFMEHMIEHNELFMLRTRSQEEIADYDAEFDRASSKRGFDRGKTDEWQRGWADAQE
jgi:hypothetical protein